MTDEPLKRLMPEQIKLGTFHKTQISHPLANWLDSEFPNPKGLRMIMGYVLPEWQRPLVWTTDQSIAFIRSAWLGLPLGTYSYNLCHEDPELDGLLIDGQQRMWAIQQYFEDGFEVFGHHWSEVTTLDQRVFKNSTTFASYITQTDDQQYLKDYYNRMNFSGTAHTEDQRA